MPIGLTQNSSRLLKKKKKTPVNKDNSSEMLFYFLFKVTSVWP